MAGRFAITAVLGMALVLSIPRAASAEEGIAQPEGEALDGNAAILFVRIESQLDPETLQQRLMERRPRFLEVPGLVQKIYGKDADSDALCGIYFFESRAALEAFRETELAKTIRSAYEVVEGRLEVYDVLFPLRPDRGPIAD